jgi:hypothetical protein
MVCSAECYPIDHPERRQSLGAQSKMTPAPIAIECAVVIAIGPLSYFGSQSTGSSSQRSNPQYVPYVMIIFLNFINRG